MNDRQSAVILVVEDNATTRKMVRVALGAEGFTVIEAPDGAAAIELMEKMKPDLVLQDLLLPDMDGFELADKLRSLPGGTSVPILACSGFLSRSEDQKATAAGFADLIVKPVEPSRLVETVLAHLPKKDAAEITGRGKKVLVVDDDPLQRKLTRVHLTGLGFDVIEAIDGAEGLDAAKKTLPDVIVSDVLMPNLDGFGFCSAVRSEPQLKRVPLILMSANYNDEADRKLAEEVGANAFVARSPDYHDLIQALHTSLKEKPPVPKVNSIEPPDAEHLHRIIRQLERQAAMNTGLAQRCALQAAELSVLSGISEALSTRREIDAALDEALSACLDAGGVSLGALYFLEPDGRLVIRSFGGYRNADEVQRFFGEEQLLRDIINGRSTVTIPSARVPQEAAAKLLASANVKSLLIVPLSAREEALGALLMASRDRDLGEEDWPSFARTVANQIGQAVALARAFSRVQTSEQRFRSLIDSMNDLVFLLDREGKVVDVHGRLGADPGLAPDAILGKPIAALLGPEAAKVHEGAAARALRESSAVYEYSRAAPDGVRHFQTSLAPMRDASGSFSGLVGVVREVTEQKRMQTQLMVSDRMVSIGALAAGVAHEINNPLASVMANLELISRQIDSLEVSSEVADDIRAMLSDAREGASRVRRIVGDLKMFSRGEDEQQSTVDVQAVMESTLRMAWNEVRHRARLVRNYQQVPMVIANESRLGQVFLNLIINAAQAIPEGKADENEIRVGTGRNGDGRVVISVSDTGSGMTPEVLKQVFDPFFTTKPAGVGVGLGLSICQRLVHTMGGEIYADSTPGQGTSFKVVLPAAVAEDVKRANGEAQQPAPSRRSGKILVVDDEKMIGSAIERMLSREHDVTATTSAQDALDKISGGARFDLIFCDLMMPVVTGMDFFQRLSEMAPEQAERVVFLTGGAFTPKARQFLDEVPNPRLDKPFDFQSLRTMVHERLSGGSVP